jgi:flavin-dependent dehydrogenase
MDAIVIGAGPAGSMAAVLLARAGWGVRLIEQSRFPRDKVCGECLSALGRSVLRRHRLESALLDREAIELTHVELFSAKASVRLDLPEPMLGISRATLDQHLLDAAKNGGATILQPWRVESIEPTVLARNLQDNRVDDLDADYILLADGRGALMGNKPLPTGDLGIKTHFVNLGATSNTITLYATDDCYGGVAPINGDRWNAAFSVRSERVKSASGDIDRVFAELKRSNPTMQNHFRNAKRVIDWIASPLPRYLPGNAPMTRIIPIGNSAAAIEPIGGEGMGLALRSAELAVTAILSGTLDRLPAEYAALWQSRSRFCRLGALAMSQPRIASISVDLLASGIVPSRPILSLIGKR